MTIHESIAKCKRFSQITGINPWEYKEPLLMAATGQFALDIVKMDDVLKTEYRDEYPDDISMTDFLIKKWGEEANNILTELIK